MQAIAGVRKLIYDHLKSMEYIRDYSNSNFNQNSNRWDIVKTCLTAGLYPNICRVEPNTGQMVSKQGEDLHPSKSSVLYDQMSQTQIDERVQQLQVDWMVFGEKIRVSRYSIVRSLTPIRSIDIILFVGSTILFDVNTIDTNSLKNKSIVIHKHSNSDEKDEMDTLKRNDEAIFIIDDWIKFSMQTEETHLLLQLRQKFATILIEFLKNPKTFCIDQRKESVISLICAVIQQEDGIEHFLRKSKMMQCTNHELIIQFNDDVKLL